MERVIIMSSGWAQKRRRGAGTNTEWIRPPMLAVIFRRLKVKNVMNADGRFRSYDLPVMSG